MVTPELSAPVHPGRFAAHPSLAGRNRAGLILTFLIGLANLPSVFTPSPGGEDEGPPFGVLLLGSICGAITVVSCRPSPPSRPSSSTFRRR